MENKNYTARELKNFLEKLDASSVDTTNWEAEFIGSVLAENQFSPKQRGVILKMIERYGQRIGWL